MVQCDKNVWFNSCTMLIVEEMSKKSLTHYNVMCIKLNVTSISTSTI